VVLGAVHTREPAVAAVALVFGSCTSTCSIAGSLAQAAAGSTGFVLCRAMQAGAFCSTASVCAWVLSLQSPPVLAVKHVGWDR
jgi:uncharacterized membrane protein (DUF4010 family)